MKIPDLKNFKKYWEFFKKIPSFWVYKITWIFLIIFIVAGIYLVCVWYFYIFNSKWNEEKKQEYINANGKEIILDKNKLNSVISKFSQRKEADDSESGEIIDIFHLR